MVKINFVFLILVLILVSSFALTGCSGSAEQTESGANSSVDNSVSAVQTQNQEKELECPRGLEHEPAPGTCPLYRDETRMDSAISDR